MKAFEERFGSAGLSMLWDEVSGWIRSPEKFFRNYSVRYLEYALGQSPECIATVAGRAAV